MKNFRQQFLLDSVKNLKNLQNKLCAAENFSDAEKREAFRTLHTIKGTAQTFGFASASRLAHELETILADQTVSTENLNSLFSEGIELLTNSFEQTDFEFPAQFVEKVHQIFPQKVQSNISAEFPPEIPLEVLALLSRTEKTALDAALRNAQNLYCFEVGFDLANFTDKFKELREILSNAGEIIATFPSEKFNGNGTIGFQILFASSTNQANIEEIAKTHAAKIILHISPKHFTNDLQGILSKVVAHGKDLANKFGKEIKFVISAEEISLSAKKLRLVFDILLHLTRNAVDHAIEKKGRVEISVKADENGLHLQIADNGNGVDLEKVKAKAIEKNLISANDFLDEQATLRLMFQSEFSTAVELTEISGRGIGLDVVKNTVEKVKGTISVKSQSRKGTTFEIFLPEEI